MRRTEVFFKKVSKNKFGEVGRYIQIVGYRNVANKKSLKNTPWGREYLEQTPHYYATKTHDGILNVAILIGGNHTAFAEGDIIPKNKFDWFVKALKICGNRFSELRKKYNEELEELRETWEDTEEQVIEI